MRWRGGNSSVSQSTPNTGGGWGEPNVKTAPRNTSTIQTDSTEGGDEPTYQANSTSGGGWDLPTDTSSTTQNITDEPTSQTNTTERGEEPTAANTSTTQTVATEGREESIADTSTTQTIVEPTVETTSTTAHATEGGEEPAFENTTKSTEASGHADEVRNSEEGERRDAVVVEASVNNGVVEKVEVETARDIGGEGDADGGNA